MSARVVPELFDIDGRIEFEKWVGRYKSMLHWQGPGVAIRWKNGTYTYVPPGGMIHKSRRGIIGCSVQKPSRASPSQGAGRTT